MSGSESFLSAERAANGLMDQLVSMKDAVEKNINTHQELSALNGNLQELVSGLTTAAQSVAVVIGKLKEIGTAELLDQVAALERQVSNLKDELQESCNSTNSTSTLVGSELSKQLKGSTESIESRFVTTAKQQRRDLYIVSMASAAATVVILAGLGYILLK